MRTAALPFVSGALFAIGLAISGMTRPDKVVAFLDLTNAWDPSLGFVMAGAIAVYLPFHRWVLRRPVPLYRSRFSLPTSTEFDPRLIAGGALFGIGWGIAGFCPGPALASIGAGMTSAGTSSVLIFVAAMAVGMLAHHALPRNPSAKP